MTSNTVDIMNRGMECLTESLGVIDAEQFITVKGFKAKGKRLSTYQIESIEELEPIRFPEEPDNSDNSEDSDDSGEDLDPDAGKSEQQVRDELTGQLRLFDDE